MADPPTQDLDFPSVSESEWRERVESELGALEFDRSLVTELDGVGRVEPLYTPASIAGVEPATPPGSAPFVRGAHADDNRWLLTPIFRRWSPEETRGEIHEELRNGADGIHLRLDRAVRGGSLDAERVGRDGVLIYRLDDLRNALDGVHLEMVRTRFEAGARGTEVAALLLAMLAERRLDLGVLDVSFGLDPLNALASEGALPRPLESYGAEMAALCRRLEEDMPRSRAIGVSSRSVHNAGADDSFELACVIACWVDYLRMVAVHGILPQQAARQTEVSIAVGNDVFVEIAKLRALRGLWSRVLEVAAGAPQETVAPCVHSFSSERSLTERDPWVNMLRVTSQGLAAAVGGADSISLSGFDGAMTDPSDLARRVARNTQLILAEESGLADVVDPAGGSYYVESLTEQLADAAWSQFQEIERAGGFASALTDGWVAQRISESRTQRAERFARRRPPITGVTAYPNLNETRPERKPCLPSEEARAIAEVGKGSVSAPDLDLDRLVSRAEAGDSVFEMGGYAWEEEQQEEGALSIEPLVAQRDAEPFERLRALGEGLPQPAIFLANIGPLKEHKPRASFAREAFGVAGLQVDPGPGTRGDAARQSAEELVDQYRASEASIVCLCGTDDRYDQEGNPIVRALSEAGARAVWMAGRPRSNAALKAAGVDGFLTAGGDLVEVLVQVLDQFQDEDDVISSGAAGSES